MKQKIPLFFSLMLFINAALLHAQTITIGYPNTTSQKVIVRNHPSVSGDIVYRLNPNNISPSFFYHDYSLGADRIFELTTNNYTKINYPGLPVVATIEIEDMVVGNTYCYFCGSIHIYTATQHSEPDAASPPDNREEYIDVREGIIGRFPLSDITDNNSISMTAQYTILSDTKKLERLRIERSANLLAAVAISNSGSRGLAVIKDQGTNNFLFLLEYPINPRESVRDLAFTTSSLVTVSEYDNDDHTFVARNAFFAGLFSGSNAQLNTAYQFNTLNINTTTTPRPSPPTKEATHDIRLADIPYTDSIVVAYEAFGGGFDEDCLRDYSNTNIYKLNIPVSDPQYPAIPNMVTSQVVSLDPAYRNGLTEVKYLPAQATVALLYRSVLNPSGLSSLVQYPSLSSFGQKKGQPTGRYIFSSMDMFGLNRPTLMGWSLDDNHLVHFNHTIGANNTCLPLINCLTEKMTLIEPEPTVSEFSTITMVLMDWRYSLYFNPVPLESEKNCETY